MRTITTAALCLLALSPAGTIAATITFDFDSLAVPRFDTTISAAMTALYDSPVATDGARTVRESFIPNDVFIATALQLLGRTDFEIIFEEVPIVGLSFEGHVIDATPDDDFRLTAYHGTEVVLVYTRDDGSEVFESGWLALDQPADRLVVSDGGRVDVGVDNLCVEPVPEASSAALLLLGAAAGLAWCRTRPTPCPATAGRGAPNGD
jgi:hypothetical protein